MAALPELTERLDRRIERLVAELAELRAEEAGARAAAESPRALAGLVLEREERWPERLAELRASAAWPAPTPRMSR